MITRRFVLAAGAAFGLSLPAFGACAAASPVATVSAFYDALTTVMKNGRKLGFAGRKQSLAAPMNAAFDLSLMTRLVVGLQWPNLAPDDQKQLAAAFAEFSVANYASEFDDYSGEKFEVDPKATPAPGNDVVVHTKLIQSDGTPVQLDYLLRQEPSGWKIIDVFLSGTISQLAARRSAFTGILREKGAPGLIAVLQDKTKELAAGG
jgi:phospholipid transport system substrate-binding protein